MQLVCKDGVVVAHYDDGVSVPMAAFPGATLQSFAGTVTDLARIGDPPAPIPGERVPDDRPYAAPALAFATLQTSLSADIDAQAEAQRLKYITPGEAQMATYLLKRGQALQALAAQAANTTVNMTSDSLAAAYPYLANEIGITVDPTSKAPATDIYGVARAVQAIAAVWQTLDLAIEKARLATKAAIAAATTVAAAQTAHDAVAWPAPPSA